MKRLFEIIFLALFLCLLCHEAGALTIASPQEGQVVYQRDRLIIIVKPDAGELWEEVLLNIYPMSYSPLTKDYRQEIEIPEDTTGTIDFFIVAYDKSGKEIELKRSLFVKLPPNVVLQSILVDDYKTLFKLPTGSSPEEARRIESRQLHVDGRYSDGIERDLTSSTSGTTYTSSDEKIVTVNSEGKMTSQSIGPAKITVRNGNLSAEVDVVVKPYKK